MANLVRSRTVQAIVAVIVVAMVISFFLPHPGAPHPSFSAEHLTDKIFGILPITNALIMSFITAVLLIVFFAWAMSRRSLVPGRAQNFAEVIVEFLLGLVESTAGKRTGRIIFPLIATLFIFIITANWLGLLPIGWFGGCYPVEAAAESTAAASTICPAGTEFVPFLRAANADLNMTLAMALIAFVVVQVAGVIANGPGGYLKELSTPLLLAPIHIVSELSRIISLSFRLFGNIFGGEVLLGVMYFLLGSISVGFVSLVFVGLEYLFGTIQALVFALLTLVYISLAVAGHGGHEGEAEHEHGDDHTMEAGESPALP